MTVSTNRIKPTKSDRITNTVITVLLILLSLCALYPLYFTFIASISNPGYIARGEIILFPKGLTHTAYDALLAEKKIWIGYRNTLFYTVGYTFLELCVTLPSAYALSRRNLPGNRGIFLFFVLTMYFSGGTVPSYLLMNKLHLVNSFWVMIIPQGIATYYLIICRNYFTDNISESLYDSARIDGANLYQFFFRFVLPLSKPIAAVMALYFSIAKWNDYMEPMIYLQDMNKQALQVIIRNVTANLDSSITSIMDPKLVNELAQRQQLLKYAVVIVSAVPLMLLYPFIQKYLISGTMAGAVKE